MNVSMQPVLEGSLVTEADWSDVVEGPLSSCDIRDSIPSTLATLAASEDSSRESFWQRHKTHKWHTAAACLRTV